MSAITDKDIVIKGVTQELREALQGRGNLTREDLEYVATAAARLKDDRFKACIAELIGWDDEQRSRLETNAAIGIEAMKRCTPSKLREAARVVETRYHFKFLGGEEHVE